jgi:Mg/Co/Ni transporter MgtE
LISSHQLLKQDLMSKVYDPQFSKLIRKLVNTQRPEIFRKLLERLNPVEISNILLQLKVKHQLSVLEMLARETASEVLTNLQDSSTVLESS